MSLCKLPSRTVKLISSSQVITAVSSVVKELIENSLDAGATNVDVKLDNYGLDKIEVKDNGSGINRVDVWNMCKKSYTSKISSFEDLNSLHTFGFRGEALHSLCTVSKMSVTTVSEGDSVAMTYDYDNSGNVLGSKMSHLIKGTIVIVENLFKNLPVRKQFLSNGRRKSEEMKKVEMVVKSLAVIHPKLRIVLTHNKYIIWQKNSVPNIRLSLIQAVAPVIVKQLVDLRHTCDQVTLHLLVPRKGCNISSACYGNSGDSIFLFVNHRPVRDKNIEKIVKDELFNHFGSEIPSGKYPTCLVSIVLPPDRLDVNLEPNKTKVILSNMDQIGNILRNKLSEYYIGPLTAPADFLEEIDAEVAKSSEKRKNDDDMVEVRVKIPKVTHNDVIDSEIPTTASESPEIRVSSHDYIKSSFSEPDDTHHGQEKEKVVSQFMGGLLAEKSNTGDMLLEEASFENVVTNTSNNQKNYFKNDIIQNSRVVEDTSNCEECPETSNTLDLNEITLSQWSRGAINIDGKTIQSSTSILTRKVEAFDHDEQPISNSEKKRFVETTAVVPRLLDVDNSTVVHGQTVETSCSNIDPLTKSYVNPDELQPDTNIDDSSNPMTCDYATGFNKYATEMSQKIRESSNVVSFGKVASEVVNKWKTFQDNECEWLNEKSKVKQKPLRILKDEKATASMRDRLKNFLDRCNEQNVLIKRKYWKTKKLDLSLSTVRKALERRMSHERNTNLQYVADLSEDVKLAVVDGADLLFFSERRLSESLFYYSNLKSMIAPMTGLESGIPVNQENLGEMLWAILVSLETAIDVSTGNVIISDNRITSNGLRIELVKDSTHGCYFQITNVPLHVASYGVEDLKEILALIEGSSGDLPLDECRPRKMINYIQAETIRSIAKSDFTPGEGNILEKFKYWLTTIKPKIKRCPHQNSLYKKININDFIS